jgi:hypothetical protein
MDTSQHGNSKCSLIVGNNLTALPYHSLRVTGTNMNYALPIYTLVIAYSLRHWAIWGQKYWPCLNRTAIRMVEAHNQRKVSRSWGVPLKTGARYLL